MLKNVFLNWAAFVLASLFCSSHAFALGNPSFVSNSPVSSSFRLVDGKHSAQLFLDADSDTAIQLALHNLQDDIQQVSGITPELVNEVSQPGSQVVIAGEIGKSPLIDQLIAEQRIDVSAITDKWEGYLIQVVSNPAAGIDKALVVAGSDRRGVVYGIYEISEQIGVSPWYWWADVPVRKSERLYVSADTQVVDWPRVKYRGIFLNDEAPALTNWVKEKYGDYNHQFYEKVFELMLRLKANYLWPAMWNNAFSDDDPLNMQRAHDYGIVMGTSHHEPMMRADKEWNRYGNDFGSEAGKGLWDYERNPDGLYDFWVEGAERNKPYDSIYTLGMRGQEDTPMSEEQNISLLETIVRDQRRILSDAFSDRPLAEVPQVWALYKEVQGYYEGGMRVPEDVTLLWADDNWGNIRRLPTPKERSRSGGAGVYYHFDYVGGPRSYRWINVTPIAKVWEQMNLAYAYGADRIWLVNVGDLKPQEFPTEFFLRMGWNPQAWPKERLQEFTERWAAREFGEQHAKEIAALVHGYSRHNGRRKPELMDADTYSLQHYGEAERIYAELEALSIHAEELYRQLDPQYRDAFFQLVLHPVKASVTVTQLSITTAKNRLYASQGRSESNDYADQAEHLFAQDAELTTQYHSIKDDKWNHMMSQPHIGYTHWNNPPANTLPALVRYQPHSEADMGVAVAGNTGFWPATGNLSLPEFSPYSAASQRIELFNRGSKPFAFSATTSAPWIQLSDREGTVTGMTRPLRVAIDWDQAPEGRHRGHVEIKGTGWGSARIAVTAFKPDTDSRRGVNGFVETSGYISIEAASFSRKRDTKGAGWEEIPLHGRTRSSISVFPASDRVYEDPAKAPYVEYDLNLFTAGRIRVQGLFAPSLNVQPGRGLRYAVALNDEEPQVIDVLQDLSASAWETAVKDGVRKSESLHQVLQPGRHRLRIFAVDPGITLQKILIDTDGLKPSYLGPPESPFVEAQSR
ncbi:glycosyl hydrolase 115 family protein [Microbulbifer bruguierae]|uniref:Glycosyl hydrolase 115 family protein n=1 Tax=Microbulbifer bruguierae TaxID=3029061 RepID=A0ABY8NKX9_9GAMM|nr:glycosyl hydrolase 115 family protein [Microbulbifer bruguierae]WGL18362.1 glycosyl hydrolase 115 family protein [Microbulbifer bruguierae]